MGGKETPQNVTDSTKIITDKGAVDLYSLRLIFPRIFGNEFGTKMLII